MRLLKLLIVALALLGLAIAAGPAQAQLQDEPDVIEIVPKVTVLDIENSESIEGEIVKPTAVYGVAKKKAEFDLTIKVRQSFLPEVMRTASAL